MSIRIRLLTLDQARDLYDRGKPLLTIRAKNEDSNYEFGVIEESYGETSAEGASWSPVEVA